jgi:DNA-binding CsgD family transcriptional regulator
MITSWALDRSLERIGQLCGSSREDNDVRADVLVEVGRICPFSAFVWPLTDPETCTGISPMARIPCPDELPTLIRLKYLTPFGRWTSLIGGHPPAVTLHAATGGDPARSPLWDGILGRYGVTDILSTVFADGHGCWGWLDLWRSDGNFPEQETAYLAAAAPIVASGLRRSRAAQCRRNAHRRRDAHASTGGAIEGPTGGATDGATEGPTDGATEGATEGPTEGPTDGATGGTAEGLAGKSTGSARRQLPQQAVLTLDAGMGITGQSASARDWLGLLQRGPRPYQTVPAEVFNVAAQLLAREAGVDSHAASARVPIGSGQWAVLKSIRMGPGEHGVSPLAVTIQECPAGERLDVFVRCFGLTQSQRRLLELAAAGLDTAALSAALGISPYTVQDQFKAVFAVCGVRSRSALLALALGTESVATLS